MNLNKTVIKSATAVALAAMPAMAANNGTIVPSFWTAWGSIDPGIQSKIELILGVCVVIMVVSVAAYTLINSGTVVWTRTKGDAVGTSSALGNVFIGVVVLFVALLAVAAIFWFVA